MLTPGAGEAVSDSVSAQEQATRAGVARDHQKHALRVPRSLVVTALRTRSVHSREILAELAWPGHSRSDVERWAWSGSPTWPVLLPGQDPDWLARYAQVLAVQVGDPGECEAARRILEGIFAAGLLRGRPVELLAQLRLVERDGAGVDALLELPDLRWAIRAGLAADRANPWLFADGAPERWATRFNGALHTPLLVDLAVPAAPVLGWEGARSPLDRLRGPALADVDTPHRVTVLMSSFRPGPELETAVRAVLEQTWSNLELLIIDDASGAGYRPFLEEIAGRDERITLIRKAVNGGTYRARNTGLRVATGGFVTTLDSDDYLHPQAIEMGMRHLLAHPGTIAVRSLGARVTPDLELTRSGYQHPMVAAGTLLFRRQQVMDRIGWFDTTSKGADTEFARRIVAAFGPVVDQINECVLLLRDGQTLSSGEFSMGWRHGARHAYKSAYGRWHEAICEGTVDPFLDPADPRPFPEPRRWMKPVVPSSDQFHRVQVCFAGDWRRYGGPQRSMLEEIAACRAAGFSVGVMHLEALRFMTTQDHPLCEPVMELIESGAVEWLQPDDDVAVGLLILRYPPILQYPPTLTRPPLQVSRLLVVANQAPLELDGSDQRYVVHDVSRRAEELFGVAPVWVPQSPRIRAVLLGQDPGVVMTDWDNPGLIDAGAWRCREERPPGEHGPVVVGRYSRDDRIKFPPTMAEMRAGYDFPEGYQVRIMGGTRSMPALAAAESKDHHGRTRAADRTGWPAHAGDIPVNWELLPQDALDVKAFLAGLDFFLYLDNPMAHEAFGRVILEAAASGVLTIVHPKHRIVFGDAVDYARPGEAQDLIASYVADPDAYRDRVRRSQELVAQRYGHAGFVERVRALLPSDADPDLDGRPEQPVRMTIRATRDPLEPVQLETERGTAWFAVPMRSLSDGIRADQVLVVHTAGEGGRAAATRWLQETLTGPLAEGAGWLGAASAPPQVRALVMVRQGTVRWSMPTPPTDAPPGGPEVRDGTPVRDQGRAGRCWPDDVPDPPGDNWWASAWPLHRGFPGPATGCGSSACTVAL